MPYPQLFFHDSRKNIRIEFLTTIFWHDIAADHRFTKKTKQLAHLMGAFNSEKLRKNRKKPKSWKISFSRVSGCPSVFLRLFTMPQKSFISAPALCLLAHDWRCQVLTDYTTHVFFSNEYATGGTIWCFLVRLLIRYNHVSFQANMGASHSITWEYPFTLLRYGGGSKIIKMTIFLFLIFVHLPFLFWP